MRAMRKGFTLIELLLVIGIIAILVSIVIVAINPTKQMGDARDAQRRTDVNTILNAVYQYSIDTNILPSGIPTGTTTEICRTGIVNCGSLINLSVLVPTYLVSVPNDPQAPATGSGTRYFIVQGGERRVTVSAPNAEQSASISVTR